MKFQVAWKPCFLSSIAACSLVASAVAQYAPPTSVTIPGGQNGPGAWPFRASASTMEITLAVGTTLGGAGSDNLKVQFQGDGPNSWSEMRHNEGDIAMGIGPFDAVTALPPNAFVNYAPGSGPACDIWRVNQAVGIPLATVRVNGRDNQDMVGGGGAVGTVYGVAYFNDDFGQGNSFHMLTGEFRNGGIGSSDLQIGLAGLANEGVMSVSATFLPYGEGWLGGFVTPAQGPSGEATLQTVDTSAINGQIYTSASPELESTDIVWQANGTARVTLSAPGGRAFTPSTGMVFGNATNGSNDANIFSANPRGTGWDMTIREDFDGDATGATLAFSESEFAFTYVDYDAPGLVGGHADGDNGGTLQSAGSFTLTRTAEGTYRLQVPGKSEADGTLLLTVADAMDTDPTLGDRTFLSYQYDAGTSSFIIQSREVTDPFNEVYDLRDSNFYFAFVDFADPFQPWIDGDANIDGIVSGGDYTIWADNFGATNAHWFQGDWNRDGLVTGADFTIWADSFGNSEATLSPVPEPSSLCLTALSALALLALWKRS